MARGVACPKGGQYGGSHGEVGVKSRACVVCVVVGTLMACTPQVATRPHGSSAAVPGACRTSPADDACDVCTAAKCCPEESACMSDSACKAADDTLDACEAKAEKAGSGLPACYDAFGATGSIAKVRADCIRSSCSKQCLST